MDSIKGIQDNARPMLMVPQSPLTTQAHAPTLPSPEYLPLNVTAVPKKNFVRPAATGPVTRAKPVVPPAVNPGMRYDDPWLRAMIVAPSLSDSMTTTLYGEPDFTEL